MTTLRVLLADDHPVVRHGLKLLIDSQDDMTVVGDVADGMAALEAVAQLAPDLVVMDLSMPKVGGAEATERIKASYPDVKILGLTAHEDPGYVRLLLEAGASGFVLKRAAAEDLVRAIRAVAHGGVYVDPAFTKHVISVRGSPPGTGTFRGPQLSARESEVLRQIAQGGSIKETAAALDLGPRTIETYRARGMEKLGLKSRADLIRYAVQRGWLKDF